jgi:cation:H+ antiporter
MSAVLLLLVGGVMLYFGAEWLVGGASRLALSLRVPQLVVGLTVVAYGTSMPEIIVGVQAARAGHGDVALGNVLGSNIANLGLILGVSTLVRPARVDGVLRRRELPVLLVATTALPLVLFDGIVSRSEAAVLVLAAVLYTAWMVRSSRGSAALVEAAVETASAADVSKTAGAPAPTSRLKQAVLAVLGLGVLLLGGQVFVEAATNLARTWGMSERMVGLTIVAVGTSLPELATGVIAAVRGNSDIAVGNVIGSNIFNVFLCLGVAGLVGRVETSPAAFAADIVALVAITFVALVFLRTARTMSRWEGGLLAAGYAGFLLHLALR